MSISKKLVIILLTVALPPLLLISFLDRQTTQALGREMVADQQALLAERARAELDLALDSAIRLMEREVRITEMALRAGGANGRIRWEAPEGKPGAIAAVALEEGGEETARELDARAFLNALPLPKSWAHLLSATLSGEGGEIARRGPEAKDGDEVIRVAGREKTTGFQIALALPMGDIRARAAVAEEKAQKYADHQLAVGWTSVGVFGVVVVLLSIIGSRSFLGPVNKLTKLARRISDGDLDARAKIHTGDELEELADSFNTMIPKLRDRIKLREALSLAMEVQQHLLPVEAPQIPGFDIAGKSIYCDETGGDYFDFLELSRLDGDCVGVAVGDVTGHGVAAALLMTTARALLRSRAHQPGSLSELMTDINRHLSEDTHQGRFMTLFYGVLDAGEGSFRWISAGHEPAVLYDPETDAFEEMWGPDIPLGIEPDWTYQETMWDGFKPGHVVTIGTDGIWETRNDQGRMFGREAMQALVRENAARPAQEICDAIANAVIQFRGPRPQHDDATLVVIKVK